MNPIQKTLATLGLPLLLATAAPAVPPLEKSHNLLGPSVGVAGYDPVAYFAEGGGVPKKGLISLSSTFEGVTYRFASKENQARFDKSPARFLPQYGGWCAWAVGALGKRVDIDPEAFEVKNGRLFLFYRDPSIDARALWLKDRDGLFEKAEKTWPSLAN